MLACTPAPGPGRVRCDVEAAVDGAAIRWADVQITSVPDFIAPLRGRIGPHEATTMEPSVWRIPVALVATKSGSGVVGARVRAVACAPGGGCAPLAVDLRGDVSVGPRGAAP